MKLLHILKELFFLQVSFALMQIFHLKGGELNLNNNGIAFMYRAQPAGGIWFREIISYRVMSKRYWDGIKEISKIEKKYQAEITKLKKKNEKAKK